MQTEIIPALQDNYIYIIGKPDAPAVVVDPGEAAPALSALANRPLDAILITHRHADHIGGVAALQAAYPQAKIYAPQNGGVSGAKICRAGDVITLLDGALTLRVIETPGHTLEHIAYINDDDNFALTGDTLFIGGCGRVFEGTMKQMHDSLAAIAALPDNTRIYCGHEYTENNLRFAQAVEPRNEAISARLQWARAQRAAGKPTIPGTLREERETNPFLRLSDYAVVDAALGRLQRIHKAEREAREAETGKPEDMSQIYTNNVLDTVEIFTSIREWKDTF